MDLALVIIFSWTLLQFLAQSYYFFLVAARHEYDPYNEIK